MLGPVLCNCLYYLKRPNIEHFQFARTLEMFGWRVFPIRLKAPAKVDLMCGTKYPPEFRRGILSKANAVVVPDAIGFIGILFVANHEQPPVLFRNDGGNQNAWIRVRLEGATSNSHGIGAHVVVRFVGGRELLREIRAGSQFLGQNESIAHFGLGPGEPEIERVWVRWPGGREQTVPSPALNELLVVSEDE